MADSLHGILSIIDPSKFPILTIWNEKISTVNFVLSSKEWNNQMVLSARSSLRRKQPMAYADELADPEDSNLSFECSNCGSELRLCDTTLTDLLVSQKEQPLFCL